MLALAESVSERPTSDSLPGEQHSDEELIAQAVHDLNRLHHESALRLACETGEYLLARFFDGDLELFRHRSSSHVSFRKLAGRDDLHFSASFLYTSLAVVEQCRQLPATVAKRLPLSHHRLLLPVKNRSLKKKLAQRAVAEALSKRQLAEQVREMRRSPSLVKRGRPPLPETVKKLNRLRRGVNELLETKASALEFNGYSPKAARELLTELMGELEEVSEVLAQLHEKVRARPARTATRSSGDRSVRA